jgi:methionine biosynthesis protein MetW
MTKFPKISEALSERADLLLIAELISPGEFVLDLGCGDGALLRHLIDTQRVKGRGIELDEASVLSCVRRGVSVRQGNLHEGLGDYPDDSFDTVILSQTMPYINDPAYIAKEMLRVGRRAIISFPNWGYWRYRLQLLFWGRMPVVPGLPNSLLHSPRARPMTVRDFEEFCLRHGIKIKNQIYLNGSRRFQVGFAKNLSARIAIYELGGVN